MNVINIIFWIIAIIFSCFYGFCCKQIWNLTLEMTKEAWLHETWFNFICSLLGWLCLFVVFKSLLVFAWQDCVKNIFWQHFFLFFIGMLGITGLLPYTLWSVSRAPDKFFNIFK